MSQKCPACGVNNPARAKVCAHCRYDFQTRQPGHDPVEAKEPAPQQLPPPVAVPQPAATGPTLVLQAPFMRLRGLVGTIIVGLMLIPTMLGALSKAPVYPLMFFFSWLLVILLVPQVLLLLRPRRIVVQGDNFLVKGFSGLITPVQNLFLVAHDGVSLCVRFHSLDAVACSPKMKSTMEKTAFRDGHHFTFPGFTFAQAEQLRQAVGLPEPPINASLSHVRSYQQEIRTLTPKLFVTKVLVAINVIVYLLMVASGCDWMQPATYDLVQWGANFGPYTAAGQGWRLLTCCFLHIGLMHLAFNMWALLSVGPLMERLLGNTGFLLLYWPPA